MQFTYGFIENNEYFSKSLGDIFRGSSAHMVDYELSLSDSAEKDIEKYYKKAYGYYISIGDNADVAIGKANAVKSYLSKYSERREEVFSLYKTYINDLTN